MKLSESDIAEITQLLRDIDFEDIELEWNDIYVRVAQRSAMTESGFPRSMPAVAPAPVHRLTEPRPAESRVGEPAITPASEDTAPAGLVEIKSSLMGTLYRAPRPGDPPFIDIGTSIQPGDTLCLLEVMKVFTALKADIAGTVERILISDGEFVEYNQVILWIRPAQ